MEKKLNQLSLFGDNNLVDYGNGYQPLHSHK